LHYIQKNGVIYGKSTNKVLLIFKIDAWLLCLRAQMTGNSLNALF